MSNNNLFSRSSSSNFRQSSASKIDQLYEISYVLDDSRIPISEHLVSLSLLSDLPRHCLAQGYTHIHFGAIRYEKGDPTVGLLGEPLGKFDYYVLYLKAEPSQPPSPPHKTPPSPHKPPPTSPPPPKLSPYNQKALSILHQDS
ncbi:hypothetical protein Tco_1063824, partial [Tanacetum coccineum]